MSTFAAAWPTLLRHEGGYVNNPNDPGGATKYGISLRWLKAQGLHGDVNGDLVVDIRDIQALTPDEAATFYQVHWWDKYGYGRINDQSIATKIIDTAVNLGAPRAHRFVQEAVGVTVDGQLGPNTILAVNSYPAPTLLHGIQFRQASYYTMLVENNPRLQEFLAGWENRAYDRV